METMNFKIIFFYIYINKFIKTTLYYYFCLRKIM